ncbi:MAG TPA: acyltransferase domain-containing protein [Polyangia bacterium]
MTTAPRPPYRADETALTFPTGGYLWPGMGDDLAGSAHAPLLAQADAALGALGVARGALARLMAGDGQARRAREPDGWSWSGDFPLSMVAQAVLGVALAREAVRVHGAPRVLLGESMGEIAAYCAAGALPLADAVTLTYRWAQALAVASDHLGLRMGVVEDLEEGEVEELAPALDARIVVAEGPHLFVVALPRDRLEALAAAVERRGGRTHVSNNHCAAHDPRLAQVAGPWDAHAALIAALPLQAPALPLLSTLDPGRPLETEAALRRNRLLTSFTRVRWDEALHTLPALGVRNVLQLGSPSSAYALKKLRGEDAGLRHVRIDVVGTLAAVRALPARLPPAARAGSL